MQALMTPMDHKTGMLKTEYCKPNTSISGWTAVTGKGYRWDLTTCLVHFELTYHIPVTGFSCMFVSSERGRRQKEMEIILARQPHPRVRDGCPIIIQSYKYATSYKSPKLVVQQTFELVCRHRCPRCRRGQQCERRKLMNGSTTRRDGHTRRLHKSEYPAKEKM